VPKEFAPPTVVEVRTAPWRGRSNSGGNIVELGMVPTVEIDDDGIVRLTIKLTISGCPLRAQIMRDVETRIGTHPGVRDVKITWGEMNSEERTEVMMRARRHAQETAPDTAISSTTRVLAIASGKGGVGKSSVSTNLAAALANMGYTVGLLDADIWGFSVPRMLGVEGRLAGTKDAEGSRPHPAQRELVGPGLIKVVSTGLLVDDEGTALSVAWPHAHQGARAVPATSFGASSTICSSTCRQARATCRWGWPACCRAPTSSSSPRRRSRLRRSPYAPPTWRAAATSASPA
jgi:metal-sulfur cluster biosynthetic enzyme